jgi:DNA-binding CsgD family transcriptional regulator/tetratricopeptide (TPR) repeat protein
MDDDDAMPAYEAAVRIVPADPPSRERAYVLAALGQILMLGGRLDEAIAAADQAIEVALAAGQRQPEGHARNTRGVSLTSIGRAEEGIAELEQALVIARDDGTAEDMGRAYVNLTESLNMTARYEESIRVGFEGLELARRLGIDRTAGVYLASNVLDALYIVGRWEEALEQADAIAARRPQGHWNYFTPASLLAELGRLDEARDQLAAVTLPEGGEAVFQGLANHADATAAVALWSGRPADVPAAIAPALERLPEVFLHDRGGSLFWRLAWAQADIAEQARGRRDAAGETAAVAEAERVLGLATALMDRRGEHGSVAQPACRAHGLLTVGEVARARGRADVEAWRSARETWDELGVVYRAAYARYREAEAMLATDPPDRDGARRLLEDLLPTLDQLGAAPLADAASSLAARSGLFESRAAERSTGPMNDGGPALTARERQVLELVIEGLSNGRIADRLFISTKTASVHVSNILAKLGVSSRTEAAAVAVRDGLLAEPVG